VERVGTALGRTRARALLASAERAEVIRRLARHAARGRIELEPALFLLGRLDAPGLDVRPYRKALDAMGAEVRERAAGARNEGERARALLGYLGEDLSIRGDAEDYHHPDNAHLHRAIERRSGLPLTLSALYTSVARRAGIPCGLVALPGHVIVRLPVGRSALFADPFRGGALISRRECMHFLAQRGQPATTAWLREASGAQLFLRQVHNLRASWELAGLDARAAKLDVVIEVLSHSRDGGQAARAAHGAGENRGGRS
jgi:regulator of sirC expression with transglutaminase-like and TPR domain